MITLYDYALSGSCYKVRLLLGFLKLEYARRNVDFYPAREHKTDVVMRLNPLGQLPVLDDDGFVVYETQAIMTYLARRYAPDGCWYPVSDARALAQINQWLAFAGELDGTASAARLQQLFNYELDADRARAGAYEIFRILDDRLWFSEREHGGWVCDAAEPTIADIACFPNVVLAPEGDMELIDFPAVRRWIDRVKQLPGFTVMPGVFPTSPALRRRAAGAPACGD